jgi:hypothetical protein
MLGYRVSHISILGVMLFVSACKTAKDVGFDSYVNTRSKPIIQQEKKTYAFADNTVFLSNAFSGARLNDAQQLNDSTIAVFINPENEPINKSPFYAFKAWSSEKTSMYLQVNYPKGYGHRYWPKLKEETGNWFRLDSVHVWQKNERVTLQVGLDTSPITIAAQEVQNSEDVEGWVKQLIAGKSYVTKTTYGSSVLNRKLSVLDIYKGDKRNKPIIVLLTRQHPPEVTGFFAFQAFLQTLLNESQRSQDFLRQYRVLAFPLVNPDGVDLGHWRHNAGGVDLNRDWSKYHQPEIRQLVSYITRQMKGAKAKLVLGLDFHSTYEDVFYTNKLREGTSLPHFISDWFKALEANIPDYQVNEAAANSNKPVSKGWFLYGHKAVGITYEIGDDTPRDRIKQIGRISAEQMMNILLTQK